MPRNNSSDDIPQRQAGATLDPADQAEVIINRESIRAAYEQQRDNDA